MKKLLEALTEALKITKPMAESILRTKIEIGRFEFIRDEAGKIVGHYQDFTFKFRLGFDPSQRADQ